MLYNVGNKLYPSHIFRSEHLAYSSSGYFILTFAKAINQLIHKMAFLTLVRHGQSTYNLENRFTGSLDVDLTEVGKNEALLAGQKLKGYHYHAAYTSMLKRAQVSLEIILKEIDQTEIPITKNSALDERMYGSLQGLNKAETIKEYGPAQVELWRRSYGVRPPGGESLEDTYKRTVPYYKLEIEPNLKANENILIVAHGNSLRALMMYLESIDQQAITKVDLPTGIPRHYIFDDDLKIRSVAYL
jgi:2,3-bisphosphoglycerate-dependent phosphoglycerate mutase